MKATIDRLSTELSTKYIQYLETFLVELRSEADAFEFKCGFTLRSEHILRSFKLKLPALEGDTQGELDLMVVVIFERIEDIIDQAIAADRTATN